MPPKVAIAAGRAGARTRAGTPKPKSGNSKKDAPTSKRVAGGQRGGKRGKVEKTEIKQKKQRMKKWLKTPADWARFDAWAKINAQPKRYPEPEPITRLSKPLPRLLKRINLLVEQPLRTDPRVHCKPVETPVTKAALNAILTPRLLKLALPIFRFADCGRALPVIICQATLCYLPSNRILCLSQPRLHERPECKPINIPSDTTDKLCQRRRLLELVKKLAACPEGLTDEERAELFTASGIRRSALEYKITPWMDFLALPWYKNIKPRDDKDAKAWKRWLVVDLEVRGKKALKDQQIKKEKRRKKRLKEKGIEGDRGEGDGTKVDDAKKEETEELSEEDAKKMEATAKKRRRARNAWRYAPLPYKSYSDAFLVKKGALEKEASPRTISLATPKERKDTTTKKKPFGVRKGALSATSSDRISKLAAPKKPLDPVEKRPPREKDKYGRPIIPMPKYGKVLPKTKPYKMGECPKKEDKEEKKEKKEKPIDPIVYEPTIDPAIYPDLAKKQKRERARAEKILAERRERRKAKQKNETGDAAKEPSDEE